jgi:hypothetical protein
MLIENVAYILEPTLTVCKNVDFDLISSNRIYYLSFMHKYITTISVIDYCRQFSITPICISTPLDVAGHVCFMPLLHAYPNKIYHYLKAD